jgi:DNA-directed RNA polymerase beta' subunit
MTKRILSREEIESILDFIKPQGGIPLETARSIVKINKEKFRKQLVGQFVYPKIIPKLKKQLEDMYERTKVQCGENVGILTAQSFGQFQTQNTLNSFHKAGMAEKTVVAGVPRFAEILGATRSPKGSSCVVHFKNGNESLQELRKTINSSFTEFKLKKLSENIVMNLDKKVETWYKSFKILHNDNFSKYEHCVSIKLKQKIIYEYSITLEQVANAIEESYSDLFCVFSPLHMGRIDVFVDTDNIKLDEDKLLYVNQENMIEVYIEDVVIPNLEKLHVCGIKGISNIFYANDKDGKWFIETEGTNFGDILAHDDVVMDTAMTNDMWEIYETLGIEATRQFLIEELGGLMSGINPCHSKLLVDKMTYNGTLTSISRYGMRGESSGALSKASFEETLDNLLGAAVNGEKEATDGVSASIICGKLGKFGTGACELRVDVSKLTKMGIIEEEVEEKNE